jgi:hypothetical protein
MTIRRLAVPILVAALAVPLAARAADDKEDGKHHHHHHHHDKKKTADVPPDAPADAAPVASEPAAPTPPTPAAPASAAAHKASAQVDLDNGQDRPWAKGVSADEIKVADALFHEGNGLLKESLFVQAAEKYREALRHWDHPAIHYNLSLALLNLDQPVEVFTHLERAMRFGPSPLELDKFEHAGRYRALIEKQVARVEVTCDKPGASITMDGQPLFTGPGHYEGMVRAGQHTFVGVKQGYVTTQKAPVLLPGEKTTIALQMFTADEMITYHRRWNNALPWSVFGAGILVAGLGGIMHWQASTHYKSYDSGVSDCATQAGSFGCNPMSSLSSKKSVGDGLQIGAFVAYGVGGATAIGGLVLAVLNRAKPVRVERENKVSVSAAIGPGGAGASATVRF